MGHTTLQRDLNTTYPINMGDAGKATRELRRAGFKTNLAGRIESFAGQPSTATVAAVWTGEKRPPRKGEWYLSGSEIEAYYAPNDLSTPYHIAKLKLVASVTTQTLSDLPIRERWAFSESELADPQACNANDELVANPPNSEIGILVQRNGTVTNRYADGTRGVTAEVREMADAEETLSHLDGRELTARWQDVIVGPEGEFIAFPAEHWYTRKSQNDPDTQ